MSVEIANEAGRYLNERATAWAALPDDELKRRASVAANERNTEELWKRTEAFLVAKGGARSKLSPHTVRNYRRGVKDLVEAWQGENLLRPTRNAPDLYVTMLDERLKPGTIRVKVAAARALYRALRWANATDERPFEDLDLPTDPTPAWEKREPYTEEEIERLLDKAGPVNRAIVLLGAHAGLRASEIVNLEWSDVDMEAGTLHVRSGKGGKAGTVALSASTVNALRDLKPYSDGPGVLGFDTTQNAYERIRRLSRRALLGKGKGLHALRHYCGTRIASELGLEAAQQHLRHSNMATTQVYAKWKDRLPIKEAVSSW
jgi:integrase/recombinase XerC